MTPENKLANAITRCITTMQVDSTTALVALMPLVAHAAMTAGLTKEEFLQTIGLAFDAMSERFETTKALELDI